MIVNFIGHGLDPTNRNTVGNILATSFSNSEFDSFVAFVAYASAAGVKLLIPHINAYKESYKQLTFYIGIDDNGTSKEALQTLVDNAVPSYIFHTPSPMIFHPKIYLFEGPRWNRLIVGSTNLTNAGLSVNVEAAVCMDFRTGDGQGKKITKQIKAYFQDLLDKSDKNIKPLTLELLDKLCATGLVKDEMDSRIARQNSKPSLNDLELFPNRDRLKIKSNELGNADVHDQNQKIRTYEIKFTDHDIEQFPFYLEKWRNYRDKNPKSGGIVKKDTEDRQLYSWFRKVKRLLGQQKEIPQVVLKTLQDEGFPFENGSFVKSRIIWNEHFEELVQYMNAQNLSYAHVPHRKNPKDPYAKLGQWCAQQKQRRKGKQTPAWTDYEEAKMNSIKFKWEVPLIGGTNLGKYDDERWLENYFKLEEYKKANNGNANPSQTDKNDDVRRLAKWLNDQRNLKNKGRTRKGVMKTLIPVREALLTELGVIWDWQLHVRKLELEKFIEGYLELRKVYPDEVPKRGDKRFEAILEKKAQIRFRYKDDTSEENRWRKERLNEINFPWT